MQSTAFLAIYQAIHLVPGQIVMQCHSMTNADLYWHVINTVRLSMREECRPVFDSIRGNVNPR